MPKPVKASTKSAVEIRKRRTTMSEVPGVAPAGMGGQAGTQTNSATGSAVSSVVTEVAEGMFTMLMMTVQQQMSDQDDPFSAVDGGS
jgi:hypothetical protein